MSTRSRPFRVTIIHPCVGRRAGTRDYVRTWMMEPIPAAQVAALLPPDVERRFHDDRLEPIPFDEPTDLVALSVETYTARRAYQIASEYRRRGVPTVMGGYHATLCPEEVGRFSESVVVGEAEELLPRVIDDYRHGRPQETYRSSSAPRLTQAPDRSLFAGKRYLPVRLVEFARGCRFRCEFCAIQSFHRGSHNHRPPEDVVAEIRRVHRPGRLVFLIDDNVTSDMERSKELFRAMLPLRIRWVGQTAIDAAFDEEALALMRASGCQGLLVGFESLARDSLKQMNKSFNLAHGGPSQALANFRRHGIRVYGTFLFGYDHDTPESFRETVRFAREEGLFIAAFNHVTPFPGTPLYERMRADRRLLHEAWWLAESYRYNQIPFRPAGMSPEELARGCLEARRGFYSWPSIFQRSLKGANRRGALLFAYYFWINAMHQADVAGRDGLPLGDEAWRGPLVEV